MTHVQSGSRRVRVAPAAAVTAALLWCCHAQEVEPPEAAAPASLEQEAHEEKLPQTPDAIFREGAIQMIQEALQKKGFSVPGTGKLDDATTAALLAFQEKENLARTGLPDHETLRRLDLDPQALYAARNQEK